MSQEYLMYTASLLYWICYVPDLASTYRNKNSNIYNIPEKLFMLIGTIFALSYAVSIKNNTLIINYTPSLILDIVSLSLRSYYAYKNRNIDTAIKSESVSSLSSFDSCSSIVIENDNYIGIMNPLHTGEKDAKKDIQHSDGIYIDTYTNIDL